MRKQNRVNYTAVYKWCALKWVQVCYKPDYESVQLARVVRSLGLYITIFMADKGCLRCVS